MDNNNQKNSYNPFTILYPIGAAFAVIALLSIPIIIGGQSFGDTKTPGATTSVQK